MAFNSDSLFNYLKEGEVMIKSYVKLESTKSFWSWLYWEFDEPAGMKNDPQGFKYCGSPYRRRFLRLFGFEFEWCYTERETRYL